MHDQADAHEALLITRDLFNAVLDDMTQTGALALAIFYVQTLTLIAQSSTLFLTLQHMVSVDAQGTTGTNPTPLTAP